MNEPMLEVSSVSKRFGGVAALDGVDLRCGRREIHALLGENGAGKSTLMHVVSGLFPSDSGEVRLEGKPVHWSSADQARTAGIAMVHQHFMLIESMTVSENVALAERAFGLLDRSALDHRVSALAAERGLEIGDPSRRVEELSVGEQQRVEILKALVDVPRLLILDEPTAVLTPGEVEDLFALLRSLANRGTAVVIVTHKLAEVFALADEVSVLRHGRRVGGGPASGFDRNSLAHLMVGDGSLPETRDKSSECGSVCLEVRGLTGRPRAGRMALADVAFEVRSGEVVVLAGVDGNGQQELQEALTGLSPTGSKGEVLVDGRPIGSPGDAREAGMAVVPGDRRRDGLVGEFSLWENMLLSRPALSAAAPRGWMTPALWRRRARGLLEEFDVRPPNPDLPAAALSGGNQQRLVLAREIGAAGLRVVLAVNPTRGLDLVATHAIHARLRGLAAEGVAVLVFSTDLDEVEALGDRVGVLYRGRLGQSPRAGIDRQTLGRRMAGLGADE